MNILLIYFSGTGNTKYLTEMLQSRFESFGHNVMILDCTSDTEIDFEQFQLIGLGYPIHAFSAPKYFEKRIKHYAISNKKYFIYKNSGEPLALNNCSSIYINRLMHKNKCQLIGEYHLIMPYNIIFKYDNNFVKQIILSNEKYLDYIVDNLLSEKSIDKVKYNLVAAVVRDLCKIQRFGARLNSNFYRIDYSKCSHCKLCVDNCPTNNIQLIDNKFHFGNQCTMCMRCSFFCPNDCIKIGLLNKWKVNGRYHFEQILNDNSLNASFITKNSRGFYKPFIKYYNSLEEITQKKLP